MHKEVEVPKTNMARLDVIRKKTKTKKKSFGIEVSAKILQVHTEIPDRKTCNPLQQWGA